MKTTSKNRKGFTIAEEVITVLLISILVAAATGILSYAMRIFCRNVISLTAQTKGHAVMEQLEDHLEYAMDISASSPITSEKAAYTVAIYPAEVSGDHVLMSVGTLKNSSSDTAGTSTSNTLCKMGSYHAAYVITVDGGTHLATIDLKIDRNGTVYYSEKRTVELKNYTGSNVTYDSSAGGSLYIGNLE